MGMTIKVTALILAGGQSSRMGEDKALVKWQNQPLLQIVCDVALTACPAAYILTPWPDRYRSIVPSDCHFLLESQPNRGPLVALAEGLSRLPPWDWVWLLACDLPRLDRKIIQNWLNRLEDIPDSTLAVVPYHDNYFEPLCGFYRVAIASSLQAFQQRGGRSFQKFLQEIPTHKLTLNDREVLMLWNCNTPADLSPNQARAEIKLTRKRSNEKGRMTNDKSVDS